MLEEKKHDFMYEAATFLRSYLAIPEPVKYNDGASILTKE